ANRLSFSNNLHFCTFIHQKAGQGASVTALQLRVFCLLAPETFGAIPRLYWWEASTSRKGKGLSMRRYVPVLALWLVWAGLARAHGLLIPEEKNIPPLAMLNHHVTITMEDQVAITRVEQTFRNHTDRQLEATYVFPVPKGASVNKFTMWVNGKEVSGEMLEAAKARQIYTDVVRRTQDPGLLEYMGNNLLRMKVFPILPKSDQKVALNFTAVATQDAGVVEYIYPLKTDGKATSTLQDFSIQATIKSQHPIQNIYSPTHAINVTRPNDREAVVKFDRNQALLDKDFQL